MDLIENEAFKPIVIGHDFCDLEKSRSHNALDPVDTALSTCFTDLCGGPNLGRQLTITQQMAGGIGTREILCAGNDCIPRNHSIDVTQLDLCAKPLAFHHCELMTLFVSAK